MSLDFEENRDPEVERKKRQQLLIDVIDAVRAAHIARLALARSLVVHKIDHGADGGMMLPARVEEPVDEPIEEDLSTLHPNAESTLFFMSMMYMPLIVAGIFVEPKTEYERRKKIFQLWDAVIWTGINLVRFNGAGTAALKWGITAGLTPIASITLLLGGYVFDLFNQWYFDYKNKEEQEKYLAEVKIETTRLSALQEILSDTPEAKRNQLKAFLSDDIHYSTPDIDQELRAIRWNIKTKIMDEFKQRNRVNPELDNVIFFSALFNRKNKDMFETHYQNIADLPAYQEFIALRKLKAILADDECSRIKKADHRAASDDAKAIEKELKERKANIRKSILSFIKEQGMTEVAAKAAMINQCSDPENREKLLAIFNQEKMRAYIAEYQEILALEQINYKKSKKELQEKIDHFHNVSLRWNIAYAIGLSSGAALELVLYVTAFGLAPLGFAIISGSTAVNQFKNLAFAIKDYWDVREKCHDKLAFINGAQTRKDASAAKNNPQLRAAFNQSLVAMGLKPLTDWAGDLNNYFITANEDILKQQDAAFSKMCLHVSWYTFVLATMACLILVANPLVGFAVFSTCIIAYTAYKASERFKLGPQGALIVNAILALLITAALVTLSAVTAGTALIPIAAAVLAFSSSAFVGHNAYNVVKETPVKKMVSDFWNRSSTDKKSGSLAKTASSDDIRIDSASTTPNPDIPKPPPRPLMRSSTSAILI